jgi:hypothetical protein
MFAMEGTGIVIPAPAPIMIGLNPCRRALVQPTGLAALDKFVEIRAMSKGFC